MAEDRDLVAMLKAGDTDALEQLIMRWRLKAEAYAQGFLHDPQAAEDAVQEAFSRIWAVRSGLDAERYLVSVEKLRPTPAKYPRRYAQIKKQPL